MGGFSSKKKRGSQDQKDPRISADQPSPTAVELDADHVYEQPQKVCYVNKANKSSVDYLSQNKQLGQDPRKHPGSGSGRNSNVPYPNPATYPNKAISANQPSPTAVELDADHVQPPQKDFYVINANKSSVDSSQNKRTGQDLHKHPGTSSGRNSNVSTARPEQPAPYAIPATYPNKAILQSPSGCIPLSMVNVRSPNQTETGQGVFAPSLKSIHIKPAAGLHPKSHKYSPGVPASNNLNNEHNSEFSGAASKPVFKKGSGRQVYENKEKTETTHKNKCITKDQLAVLSGKSDQEILFRIQNFSSGFLNLLHESNYPDDVLILVMDILARVCRNEDCPHTTNAILQTVLYTKLFNDRMVRFLQTAPYDGSIDKNPMLLKNLLIVFTTALREFKTEAESKLGRCLTLGKRAIAQQIEPYGDIEDDLIKELHNLVDVQRLNEESKTAVNAAMTHECPFVFDVNYEPPPDVKPETSKDYKIVLFNLLQKAFADTFLNKDQSSKVDIYCNVRVIDTDCTFNEGFIYKLKFGMENHEVPWDNTTKLLHGSTVLLAPSLPVDLKLHCAVVARRCPEELAEGQVWVKPLNRKSTVLQSTSPLTMLENFTYIDDFISLMAALCIQLDYPLPFEKYILGRKKKLKHPMYLDDKTVLEFPLLKKTGVKSKKHIALNTTTWPSADCFGHDEHWNNAFKHALTTSLALIHCPSKVDSITFGATVLQTILHNEAMWPSINMPVTVMFHSDKALDSFLQEILAILPEEKVIRMGGKCTNIALENYTLCEARKIVYSSSAFPSYVIENRKVLLAKMRKLKADITYRMELLERSKVCVLKSNTLKACIAEKNWNQLMILSDAKCDSDPLLNWLSINTPRDLRYLNSEQSSSLKSETKVRNKLSKEDEVAIGETLSKIEMARRISSTSLSLFCEMEKDFKQKSIPLNTDACFIATNIRNQNSNLLNAVAAELKREDDLMQASEVNDIRYLGICDRWRLYRYWRFLWEKNIKEELAKQQDKYEKSFLQLQEVVREIDVSILRRKRIVGVTTAAASKYHRVFKMLSSGIIIVEEAGQIAEPNLLSTLTEHCCHLIMIGDHQLLKPTLNGFHRSDNTNHPSTISLFESLIAKGISPALIAQEDLKSSFMLNVLNGLYNNSSAGLSTFLVPTAIVKGMVSDIFFINNSSSESVDSLGSYINEDEANYLVLLSKYLVGQGHAQSDITILASYIRQVNLLKQLCITNNLIQIECTTVDDYQGKSNVIVLLSLVRSNDYGDMGSMADENYMHVALTRARSGLYCIGNFKMLVNSSDLWKTRITFLVGQLLYGSTLLLKCDQHPMEAYKIDSCVTLQTALKGLCKQTCLAIMSCGHQCMKACHDDDRDHKKAKCELPCRKVVCPLGHKCFRACFEKCTPCEQSVWKERACGHESLVKCHESQQEMSCTENCEKSLSCGHACQKLCGEQCACSEIVEYKELSCKHSIFIPCNQRTMKNLDRLCAMPCTEKLQCNHACTGTCGQCNQGRMHIPCRAKCESVLICGHQCKELCSSNCLPCKDMCGSRCYHARCSSSCGAPCVPCLEPCVWQCNHQKCQKLCFEPCDRIACNLPCPRILSCRHPCIGFCGESCPPLCRICNRGELVEGMLGSQKIDAARFILLENCNHVVEVTIMDMIMQANDTIEVKSCPLCSVPIRNCLRYGNHIKASMFDINRILHNCRDSGSGLNLPFKGLRHSIEVLPESLFTEAVHQMKSEIQKSLNCIESTVLENKYKFMKSMLKMWNASIGLASKQDMLEVQRVLLNLKECHMVLLPTSGQTIIDAFAQELKRAMYLVHLFQSFQSQSAPNASQMVLYSYLRRRLTDAKTFNLAVEEVVSSQMKKLYLTLNIPVNVEDIADLQVSDILQMTAGHWSKCPKGHFCFAREKLSAQNTQCKNCALAVG